VKLEWSARGARQSLRAPGLFSLIFERDGKRARKRFYVSELLLRRLVDDES
jgi:hypothetical protein